MQAAAPGSGQSGSGSVEKEGSWQAWAEAGSLSVGPSRARIRLSLRLGRRAPVAVSRRVRPLPATRLTRFSIFSAALPRETQVQQR